MGRDELNLSDWEEFGDEADDAAEMVEEGAMPPDRYTVVQRDARLSAAERDTLLRALMAMDDEE